MVYNDGVHFMSDRIQPTTVADYGPAARRLFAKGPKRILSLDGGGVRGMITIGFLEAIEAKLRQIHGRPQLVLSEYFDLIGGTSVGSMIATMLALGWPMEEVRERFLAACPIIFPKSRLGLLKRRGIFRSKFSHDNLKQELENIVGNMTLDSEKILTGLAIVAKRVDSGSPWVVYNNPCSKYWENETSQETGQPRIGNRYYRIADLIRASTAAPTFFQPHSVRIHEPVSGDDGLGHFADGGVSPYNDPSLLMLMMAGIKGYRLGGCERRLDQHGNAIEIESSWVLGPDKLYIVSVGTGAYRVQVKPKWWLPAIFFAKDSLLGMMADTEANTLKLMQWMSKCEKRWLINGEVGTLANTSFGELAGAPGALCSFIRYNVRLEKAWMVKNICSAKFTDKMVRGLQAIDDPRHRKLYFLIAMAAAQQQVTPDDFPNKFRIDVA